jgi:hypothetical protein
MKEHSVKKGSMIKCVAVLADITIRVALIMWRLIMSRECPGVSIFNEPHQHLLWRTRS